MTVVLLVRHALCDPIGVAIAGRRPGVHLNAAGAAQATTLARALAATRVTAVYSSPLERALETAEPVARVHGLAVRRTPGLTELDFGEWTGRSIAELERQPLWRAFNERREATRIPGGERMDEVVSRAASALADIVADHAGERVVAVTHGDVIRGVLAHYLGMPLGLMLRLEIDPGSVSPIELTGRGVRVLATNWRPAGPL